MQPNEFVSAYLPPVWEEEDLQDLLHRRIKTFTPWPVVKEERIKTVSTTRRADLATWCCVYEVKKYLTREAIFHAVAQTEMYAMYSSKILWLIPKRRVIVGLAPWDSSQYAAAKSVAADFTKKGINVVFINESPHWRGGMKLGMFWSTAIAAAIAGLSSYCLVSLAIRGL